jgi:hypothetical protein
VAGAIATDSSRENLAAFSYEFFEPIGIFVINKVHFVGAKPAGFSSSWWRVLHGTHRISSKLAIHQSLLGHGIYLERNFILGSKDRIKLLVVFGWRPLS